MVNMGKHASLDDHELPDLPFLWKEKSKCWRILVSSITLIGSPSKFKNALVCALINGMSYSQREPYPKASMKNLKAQLHGSGSTRY